MGEHEQHKVKKVFFPLQLLSYLSFICSHTPFTTPSSEEADKLFSPTEFSFIKISQTRNQTRMESSARGSHHSTKSLQIS